MREQGQGSEGPYTLPEPYMPTHHSLASSKMPFPQDCRDGSAGKSTCLSHRGPGLGSWKPHRATCNCANSNPWDADVLPCLLRHVCTGGIYERLHLRKSKNLRSWSDGSAFKSIYRGSQHPHELVVTGRNPTNMYTEFKSWFCWLFKQKLPSFLAKGSHYISQAGLKFMVLAQATKC